MPAMLLLTIQETISTVLNQKVMSDTELKKVIVLWSLLIVSKTLFEPFVSFYRIHLNEKILEKLNIKIMKKINSFYSLELFENSQIYCEIQFIKEEAKSKPLNFVYVFSGCLQSGISLCSILMVLFFLVWWLPILIIIALIPYAISIVLREKKSWDLNLFNHSDVHRMHNISQITCDYRAAKELRLFGFGDFLIKKYTKLSKAFQKKMHIGRKKLFWKSSVYSLLHAIMEGAIFILILCCVKVQLFDVAVLAVLLQALIISNRESEIFFQSVGLFTHSIKFFEKYRKFLNRSENFYNAPKNTISSTLKGPLTFSNVSFYYSDERIALQSINLSIESGEKIAVVGENGSGKSTLVKLLCRLYDPQIGEIKMGNTNIKDIDITKWRNSLSAVFQDFGQYQMTVFENIGIGNIEACRLRDQVKSAAKKGGIYNISSQLPQHLHTLLGKEFGGTDLSYGEWQRIALARAFMRNADILILDEPTAAIDIEQERKIFDTFDQFCKNKTALLITHRLSAIPYVDRIIFMQKGRILEQGSHLELLKLGGEYAKLYELSKIYQTTPKNQLSNL